MSYEHHLSVAAHIATRETGRSLRATREGMQGFRAFQDAFVESVDSRFEGGRQLKGETLARLADDAAKAYAALSPAFLHRGGRAPTRTRPKSETRNIHALAAYAARTEGGDARSLMALRLHIDRKCAHIDQEHLGIGYTRHMMIRAMERDLVSRTGGFREIDAALIGYQGLLAAWRCARRAGLVPKGHNLHLPFSGGLLLGQILPSHKGVTGLRTVVDRDMAGPVDLPPNPFRTETDEDGAYLSEWVCRSAVGERQLSRSQRHYRDAALAFNERHADLFALVNGRTAWTGIDKELGLSFADAEAPLIEAGRELARLVTSPNFAIVYQDRGQVETNPLFLRGMAA